MLRGVKSELGISTTEPPELGYIVKPRSRQSTSIHVLFFQVGVSWLSSSVEPAAWADGFHSGFVSVNWD